MKDVVAIVEYCRDIPQTIKLNRRVITNLEDMYYLPKSASQLDGMPKSKNSISKLTEEIALNIPDGVNETIRSLIVKNERLDRLNKEILKEIQGLEYREHKVIYDFYIMNYNWEKIARGFYSVRQCKNIRNQALKKLQKKFEDNIYIHNYFSK